MLQEITRTNLTQIKNPVFRKYAAMYLDIYDSFQQEVESFGLSFHRDREDEQETAALLAAARALFPAAWTPACSTTASPRPAKPAKKASAP